MGLNLSTFALDLAVETKAFVVDYVGKALAGISDRCTALEQQLAVVKTTPGPAGERGETGPAGPPGRDAEAVDLSPIKHELDVAIARMHTEMLAHVRDQVSAAFASLRVPADGRDGRDADMHAVKAMVDASVLTNRHPLPDVDGLVQAAVTKALAAVTMPRDGLDGKDGAPGTAGRDGVDGKDGASVTLADVQPLIAAEVQRVVSLLPPAKDGQDGAPGPAGRDGVDGKDGADGKDGRDGLPGVPGPQGDKGMDGRDGLNGKDGAPGMNGKDGTTFQEFGFTIDDDLGPIVHLKSSDGALEARFPGMWDAGVWRAGKHYPRGAGVSWNGSTWIAQKDTKGEKPGDGSGVWRLAVKAGRDAKPPRDGS